MILFSSAPDLNDDQNDALQKELEKEVILATTRVLGQPEQLGEDKESLAKAIDAEIKRRMADRPKPAHWDAVKGELENAILRDALTENLKKRVLSPQPNALDVLGDVDLNFDQQ